MQQGAIREKLDQFIRKFYLNQFIRGLLLGFTLILGAFLFINLSEYYGHFSTLTRAIFFWSFIALLGFVLYSWVFVPILGLYKLGKVISYSQAAGIIGNHFEEIKDKLLNLLQLEEMAAKQPDSALLLASVEQKTNQLKPIPFSRAINLAANKRYLRYLGIPVILFGVIIVFQSSIITDGAERILHYNKQFKVKAPFEFVLLNKTLEADRGSDFELKLGLKGRAIPENVYLLLRGQLIKMTQSENGNFSYTLKNLNGNEKIQFSAADFFSEQYEVAVIPNPAITSAEAQVIYPAYTGKASEYLNNTTEFTIPEGTEINWKFKARDAESLQLVGASKTEEFANNLHGKIAIKKRFTQNTFYKILLKNKQARKSDTMRYFINVIPDRAPGISAEKREDSTNIKQYYFLGNATDDYGLSAVTFNYRYTFSNTEGKTSMKTRSIKLPLQGVSSDASFYYVLNMDALGMAPSDEVEYYFEAWDNDAIHGSKSSRTQPQMLRRQSLDEIRQNADASSGKVKNMLSEAQKQATALQKESKDMQDELNRQKSMNWDDKSRVQDLLNKQKDFQKKLEEIKNEQDKLRQQKDEFQGKNEELEQRQKQLDELFKKMEDPELKKLMEEIQKLLDKQASKEEINQKLDELQKKNNDWSKEMDKLKEQFKQLQLEQKIEDNINRLKELADKQEKLAEKTKNAKSPLSPELKKEQDVLKKELDKINEDLKEAEKMNSELEKPMSLETGKQEQQDAGNKMDDASKNLENEKNKKASEDQKDAVEKLRKAAQKMQDKMDSEKKKRTAEDYQKVRQLLENLVQTSFTQENIFLELADLRDYNPRFVELNKKQMSVKEDCAMLEDSLRAMAKRQPAISTFITSEIGRINSNMEYALTSLKVRKFQEAAAREQFVMTGLNNLAVMLLESLENMQQQMSKDKKQGNQSCNNPNKSGKSGKMKKGEALSKGQEQLGKMMQELQKKAQEQRQGKQGKDGKGQPQSGKDGQKELNKDYAQIALMQEALRRQLNELRKNIDKDGAEGKAAADELRKIEELMEQQERDLVNKRITPDMIRRQEEIKTRLFEHERADRNQQTEEKREAGTPPNYKPTLPPQLEKYMKDKQREREMLRRTPAELTPYYRDKSREYLRTVN